MHLLRIWHSPLDSAIPSDARVSSMAGAIDITRQDGVGDSGLFLVISIPFYMSREAATLNIFDCLGAFIFGAANRGFLTLFINKYYMIPMDNLPIA